MLLIIGTYRKRAYIERALESIAKHATGITKVMFVDDSGDEDHRRWLFDRTQLSVVPVAQGRSGGYNAAMKLVCEVAGDREFMFWEEDFTATAPIDLNAMSAVLAERPYLAQLALLRQPWFPIEHEHGGLLEALRFKGAEIDLLDGVWEQTATFTCNPAVWRAGIAAEGWPDGKWSEDRKRDELVRQGYMFGFLPGVRVQHDGERSGHGY